MSAKRIILVVLVFGAACVGWSILGTTVKVRSHMLGSRLGPQVCDLWGSPLAQKAPAFTVQIPGTEQVRHLMPTANQIDVKIDLDYRRKGLIWYPTYKVSFDGRYTVTNDEVAAQKVRAHFDFPAPAATYDAFLFEVDGSRLVLPVNTQTGISELLEVEPGVSRELHVAYETQGLGDWRYCVDPDVGRVQGLELTVTTNFVNVDYPPGSRSPTSVEPTESGMLLRWEASDLITTQQIGVVVPGKLNPGPLSTRITFFAPVCLLFFFLVMAAINILRKIPVHPMHYLFIAAGFFAFHLLFAYLVDHLNVHLSFGISAVISVTLVVRYLASALGSRFPWKAALLAQVFYLVLFSYSFFLKGMTGLTVTVGAVVTLAVMMTLTAKLDWDDVFARPDECRRRHKPVPPPVPQVQT